jgi:hypothetical protein
MTKIKVTVSQQNNTVANNTFNKKLQLLESSGIKVSVVQPQPSHSSSGFYGRIHDNMRIKHIG